MCVCVSVCACVSVGGWMDVRVSVGERMCHAARHCNTLTTALVDVNYCACVSSISNLEVLLCPILHDESWTRVDWAHHWGLVC